MLDPGVAIKFGDNKAVQSPLQLEKMFDFYATKPETAIASPNKRLHGNALKVADYTAQIEEARGLF
jgi:hypothetical protein